MKQQTQEELSEHKHFWVWHFEYTNVPSIYWVKERVNSLLDDKVHKSEIFNK